MQFAHMPRRAARAASTWIAIGIFVLAAGIWQSERLAALVEVTRFAGPISSQPLALSGDGSFLAAVNPDNNSVSLFDLRADKNKRLAMVPVQSEPNGVVLLPNGRRAYIANTVSGTVSVMDLNIPNGFIGRPRKHIAVGVEPYSLVLSPNATKLYVANARSNTISVVSTTTETVIKTIQVPAEPRGLAMSNDDDADDDDETLYVTHFLSFRVGGKADGSDDARNGGVTIVSTTTDTVTGAIIVNPIADSGFKANGDALARVAPGANFTFPTGAFPNQLNNIAIKGAFAYLPNTGASPNGPVRFDVNTQSLLSVLNRGTRLDAGKTINMHRAVADQTAPEKLFVTQPWAMSFKHADDEGYVVSAASNVVVKVTVNPATGAPVVVLDPTDPARVLQVPVGKNPRGIVVNRADTRAYVMNYVSRDVSVIDLTGPKEALMATIASAPLPMPGTLAATIHIGKELYNTSVGVFDPAVLAGPPIVGRMSKNGWGACSTCHPNGLSDNVVWIFGPGPRRTIPQHADFDQSDPTRSKMRILNWSAERDEQEDFELNIRGVSGGDGLIVLGDGVSQDPAVTNLTPLANGGREQLTVSGVPAWDAIKAYVQFGIRAPISPVSKTEPDVIAGRALFASANCQQCHGGAQWTSSRVRFTPPPAAGLIVAGQIIGELRQVGTFDATAFNEVRQNATPSLGADGFAPPSLLSGFAFSGSHLHGGAADSLEVVMQNVVHRSAGTGGVDTLSNPSDRAKVARFVQSIDAASVPFP
jgi:YVTN family beta-propeller protein